MAYFKIIPILGLRTDYPEDDKRLFKFLNDEVALTHGVDGSQDFDLLRQDGTCYHGWGQQVLSADASGQHTLTLGLFHLYDGTNRNNIHCDNGKVYYLDSNRQHQDVSGAVTLANTVGDIYSMVQVGSHIVIADRGETTPYCWKHGDAAISKAISSGTEFKFRYLTYFAQRLFGLYSDQTNGDIDIRWTGVIPVPGTTCVFGAANQLYAPNDDPISGVAKMGENNLFVLCDNSIQQIIHYPSNLTPFQAYTVVADQGSCAPYSVIALSDRIYFYNWNYGFCEYRGGNQFPFGGKAISEPINDLLLDPSNGVRMANRALIQGAFIPFRRQIMWAVPIGATPSYYIFTYDIDTGNWSKTAVADLARYIQPLTITWNSVLRYVVAYGATDGWVKWSVGDLRAYYIESAWSDFAYVTTRVEPVIDFGNPRRTDLITEIWFDLPISANLTITVQWRGGDTLGELLAASFADVGTLSSNSPSQPFISANKSARLHQIKWTCNAGIPFAVNGITFKYQPGSER